MNKRWLVFSTAICFLFATIIGRLGYIMFSGDFAVSSSHNSYTLDIDRIYPTVYDRSLSKITNKTDTLYAVIRPNEKCLAELNSLFDYNERNEIIDELKQGYPVIREIDNYVKCKYIKIFETTKRHDDDLLSSHIIASCEKIYSDEVGSKSINFAVDAIGRLLDGDEGTIIENNYNSKYGVSLTIDSKIQKEAELAAKSMLKGAVVVLDTETSEVLASYSKPNDYLNRAFSSYSVGSVYKLVVAAAALEGGINETYECVGEITVGDTTFACQKNKKHGKQTIKEALANSCNCYFVDLALKLGAEKITEVSEKLGFGDETVFNEEWKFTNGNFPDLDFLKSKGQLALLGFGQGSLTATPLHFCSVVAAIANGGIYTPPSLILGEVDNNGNLIGKDKNKPSRAMSEKTAETLREYMRYVVTNGTGMSAEYNNNSAGKTSTAESGIYVENKEILNTWFAGFYPYDNPKYAIVVLTEDGVSGSTDCCPVFRTIVENIG